MRVFLLLATSKTVILRLASSSRQRGKLTASGNNVFDNEKIKERQLKELGVFFWKREERKQKHSWKKKNLNLLLEGEQQMNHGKSHE